MQQFLDKLLFGWLVRLAYPRFRNLYPGQVSNWYIVRQYFILQKILRINGSVPWPVDFRSKVINWRKVVKDEYSYPGGSPGCYINADGGIAIGSKVILGPNVILASVNHSMHDHSKQASKKGIIIGDNVWIGGNTTITAGVEIGSNVTIGAGLTIRQDIPSNSVVKHGENSLVIEEKREA